MYRCLRSAASQTLNSPPSEVAEKYNDQPVRFISASSPTDIQLLMNQTHLPGLNSAELRTLRKKQMRLQNSVALTQESACENGLQAVHSLASTLIFAQEEAGTAVCIHTKGWILTCAHCFGETVEEWTSQRQKWLLYYTGKAVQVECHARLGRTTRSRAGKDHPPRGQLCTSRRQDNPNLHFHPAGNIPNLHHPHFLHRQPGADDLESASRRKTAYDLIEVSAGRLRGQIPSADPHDNSEIGVLKHNAWTYWGHSGAPLLRASDGNLLGLHSSWDDATSMRHGVPLVAIRAFLEYLPRDDMKYEVPGGSGGCMIDAPRVVSVGTGSTLREREIIVIDSSN
ncbi:hypothetical protein N7532_002220 [Penicillium argentinense]|uniref:Uncharacterized protein n=1 Tax=Penicillium argentinense TaxID=1131581 RepID=A0A9W9KKE1_9EURO|nr:uncharacterized protein N7532_002220 [Penicillium argentinense]KAJ5109575.1 hypothetical protein N7532_002220 [Penicillium argentinense]